MVYQRDGFHVHLANVELLNSRGIAAAGEWLELRRRFADYIELAHPIGDRLAGEILDPSGEDLGLLRAAALAEEAATSVVDAAVTGIVRNAVHGRLVELYRPHAGRNYAQVAEQFDSIAAQFARCAKVVDPEADSDTVVKASDAARRAWFDAAALAADLDAYVPVLVAAASLVGLPPADDGAEVEIALTVDTNKIHRRRLFEAWGTTTARCGRWSAVSALGAGIRAHRHPEKLQPYTAPRPLESRWVPGKYGGYEVKTTDPEDNGNGKAASPADADDWSIA